jgi:hypothetical protein
MPEYPPMEEISRISIADLSSDGEAETGGQPGPEPLVTGPTIHHCTIGMVVIQHQQCHLLHNQLFHPPDDDLKSGNLKNVKKRSADSDADGQPASQAARLPGGSSVGAVTVGTIPTSLSAASDAFATLSNALSAAAPVAPMAPMAPDAPVAPETQT